MSTSATTAKAQQRLRVLAIVVMLGGIFTGFVVGLSFPAAVTTTAAGLGSVKATNLTSIGQGGATAFNWLLFLLVVGPAVVAASVLLAGSEMVGALGRRSRSSSSSSSISAASSRGEEPSITVP